MNRDERAKRSKRCLVTIVAAVIEPAGREREGVSECVVQKRSVHIIEIHLCYGCMDCAAVNYDPSPRLRDGADRVDTKLLLTVIPLRPARLCDA